MIQKNRALHELPYTEIEKSGHIRLAIEVNLTVQIIDGESKGVRMRQKKI